MLSFLRKYFTHDNSFVMFLMLGLHVNNTQKINSLNQSVTMEWTDKENRLAVIALQKCKIEKGEIFWLLKPLGISRMFVYRCVKLFEDTCNIKDRQRSGRPRTVRTPGAIRAVKARILRNLLRKQKIMARGMGLNRKSMSCIIKKDLGLGAYKRRTGPLLTAALEQNRVKK